ncbi:hypothetical protein [Streptomyces aurantiogriseus]|uniref:Uncharacterized protein n=1 Tax=Streptomyces aurantiogriseus TaxID=66870 RepID=A0A918FH40_9ACTN|nr:hypothetical protein [Streptomyces aurantiogriseus]GGR37150.1 hypothetical protein GCM10010251_62100 [Streptomyces aurantiogriseus]
MRNGTPSEGSTEGDYRDALSWINASSLGDEEKQSLRRFAEAFSTLRFTRDSSSAISHCEQRDRVHLPQWFRQVRQTLSFTMANQAQFPPVLARFGGYDFDCNMADSDAIAWYQIKVGVMGEDDRDLFVDSAGLYPIATWFGTNESYLAINLRDPEDRRIHEFSGTDFWDNFFNGESLEGTSEPAFSSYARMLSHITAVKFPDGREVQASRSAI